MEERNKKLSVKIVSPLTEKFTQGTVEVQQWSKKEQTQRALKYGAICWGLALLAVPLPIVHFILVPTFLIAGPVAAYYFLKQEGIVLGGTGACPECDKPIQIARASSSFPLAEVCPHCRRNLKVLEQA